MHFERMGVHVGLPNHNALPKINPGHEYLAPQHITKAVLTRWIERASLNEEVKMGLMRILESSPANTMHHFYKNIHEHIARIQDAIQQRQKDNPEPKVEE